MMITSDVNLCTSSLIWKVKVLLFLYSYSHSSSPERFFSGIIISCATHAHSFTLDSRAFFESFFFFMLPCATCDSKLHIFAIWASLFFFKITQICSLTFKFQLFNIFRKDLYSQLRKNHLKTSWAQIYLFFNGHLIFRAVETIENTSCTMLGFIGTDALRDRAKARRRSRRSTKTKEKGKNLSYNSQLPKRDRDFAIKVKRPAILWYSALLRAQREASLGLLGARRKRVTKSEDLKATLDGLRSRQRRDEEKVSYFCQRSWLVCWTFSSIRKCCRFMKRDIWFRVSKDFFFFINPASLCALRSSTSIRYVSFIVFYISP